MKDKIMNKVTVRLKANESINCKEAFEFNFDAERFKISYSFRESDHIEICIESESGYDEIFQHFLAHYHILFLNAGYFYEVRSYVEGEDNNDISKERFKNLPYSPSWGLLKEFKFIHPINSSLISAGSLNNYYALRKKSVRLLNILFYIHSCKYSKIPIDHRVAIVLQVMEGWYSYASDRKQHSEQSRENIYSRYFRENQKNQQGQKGQGDSELDRFYKSCHGNEFVKGFEALRNFFSHFTPSSIGKKAENEHADTDALNENKHIDILFGLLLSLRARIVEDLLFGLPKNKEEKKRVSEEGTRFSAEVKSNINENALRIIDYTEINIRKTPNYNCKSQYYKKQEAHNYLCEILEENSS